jgi:hypothetical protein
VSRELGGSSSSSIWLRAAIRKSPLRGACKGAHVLATELFAQHGIRISDQTVAKMPRKHGYTLLSSKAVEGAKDPNRTLSSSADRLSVASNVVYPRPPST